MQDNNLTKKDREGAANRSGFEGVIPPKYDKGDYCWKKEIWVKFFESLFAVANNVMLRESSNEIVSS